MTIKYYFGQIEERHGEREICTTIKFATELDPDVALDNIASDWYDDTAPREDGGYESDGWIYVWGGSWQEVGQEVFDAVKLLVTLHADTRKDFSATEEAEPA